MLLIRDHYRGGFAHKKLLIQHIVYIQYILTVTEVIKINLCKKNFVWRNETKI